MKLSTHLVLPAWHMLTQRPVIDWERVRSSDNKWSREKAWEWYKELPWLLGCNYIPAYAGNQIEMWGKETFDPGSIDRELQLLQSSGMNTVRVFLHDLLYEHERDSFFGNMDVFLHLCYTRNIKVMFVFFDDCWNPDPVYDQKYTPVRGLHNSIWLQSPGRKDVLKQERWGLLEKYVIDTISRYGNDDRVICWDLYNEPGASGLGKRSAQLLQRTFLWARAGNPSQPLTSGFHIIRSVADIALANSDIVTFHHYGSVAQLEKMVKHLQQSGRPLICTEYMARSMGSLFSTHIPWFFENNIGALHWGLVSGRSNTIYPWTTLLLRARSVPKVWFHDLFYPDHQPYNAAEIELLKTYAEKAKRARGWS